VVVSKRLVEDPVVISTAESGYTANMERISKSQAYANSSKIPDHMAAKKILEINPGHPAIKQFLKEIEDGEDSQKLKDRANVMY
jgi:heat shock protein beta